MKVKLEDFSPKQQAFFNNQEYLFRALYINNPPATDFSYLIEPLLKVLSVYEAIQFLWQCENDKIHTRALLVDAMRALLEQTLDNADAAVAALDRSSDIGSRHAAVLHLVQHCYKQGVTDDLLLAQERLNSVVVDYPYQFDKYAPVHWMLVELANAVLLDTFICPFSNNDGVSVSLCFRHIAQAMVAYCKYSLSKTFPEYYDFDKLVNVEIEAAIERACGVPHGKTN